MKISTEIHSAAQILGEEKAIEYIAKAGFDAWDFSLFRIGSYDWDKNVFIENEHPLLGKDYLSFAKTLKQIGLDNGIVCNQSHAPFPSCAPEVASYFKKAIECTAEAGADICVIHPDSFRTFEENAEMYLKILPFAKECGVKIATENMWEWDKIKDEARPSACATPENFNNLLELVDDDCFVACLDIGHAEMRGVGTTAVELIKNLGAKLQSLHIHDNDKWHDSHQIPFSMQIDFESIVAALKEINYDGYFTLEANAFLKDYAEDNVFNGIVKLAESAKRLALMYEGKCKL